MATKLTSKGLFIVALLGLSACMGNQTGKALNALDTESAEEKEEDAWFKSFYGSKHCGVWEGTCKPGSDEGGSGGGGMWSGGVGPDGDTSSH